MEYPQIVEARFDAKMDPGINSKLLRAIFEIMGTEYSAKTDCFASDMPWGVCIEDQHDNEKNPHYILEVGSGIYDERAPKSYFVRYCDYHSVPGKKKKNNSIITDPGKWIIRIWLPKGCGLSADDVAEKINLAYAKAMEEELPDYEILYSKKPIPIR